MPSWTDRAPKGWQVPSTSLSKQLSKQKLSTGHIKVYKTSLHLALLFLSLVDFTSYVPPLLSLFEHLTDPLQDRIFFI